ncbi:MAG TPA: porin, partial [Polyangium sp.]|nr:porin [Polyangium sp.]
MKQTHRGKGSFHHRLLRRSMAASCLMAVAGLSAGASAQDAPVSPGLALNRFNPAPAGDRMFGVQSAYVAGELTPHAALLFDYARNPLVLKTLDSNKLGAVVSDQLHLHINAGFAFGNKVNFNISFPIALMQAGDSPSGGGLNFTSPSGLAAGDLRFGARVNLIGNYWDPFQL